MPLLGAKEGIAHLCQSQLDPGDVALVADPRLPGLPRRPRDRGRRGGRAAPARRAAASCPTSTPSPTRTARRANLLICGYPNNPTGAVADLDFLQRLARFGLERGVPIAHDNAYAELTYDGFRAPSFLAAPDGIEAGIEIYSLSKALNMPGWRVAFAVGNGEMLQNLTAPQDEPRLGHVPRDAAHGDRRDRPHRPVQHADGRALHAPARDRLRRAARDRRGGRRRPRGSIYVWAPRPGRRRVATAFAARALAEGGVVVGSGASYGEHGEGYVRLSLTVPDDRLAEAMDAHRQALHLNA